MRLLPLLAACAIPLAWAQSANTPVAVASHLAADQSLNTDPNSGLWREAPSVVTDHGPRGEAVPGHRTEIRLRWTPENLYVFFVCPYEILHLKPEPDTKIETNRLWNYDVAEIFIGADFEKIWQYREYQVSPQGEWVDLDIDTKEAKPEGGWGWNSGFQVAARIDQAQRVWYGALKIPFDSIRPGKAKASEQFRVNFYRIQGPPPNRRFIAWNPVGRPSYHTPEAFGLLRLEQ